MTIRTTLTLLFFGLTAIGGCGKSEENGGPSPNSGKGAKEKEKAPPAVEKPQDMGRNERSAMASMLVIQSAEFAFKQADEDKNGIQDFWVADLAGLLKVALPREKELAEADASQPSPRPNEGYLFAAITHDEDGTRYNRPESKGRNKDRFAFCGYPATYGKTGRRTFIIGQENVLFQKDTEGKPVQAWPKNPESEGWKKMD